MQTPIKILKHLIPTPGTVFAKLKHYIWRAGVVLGDVP